TGRAVLPMCCARGIPAAQPEGLGRTVAGTVGRLPAAGVGVGLAALAVLIPGTPWWQGPVAVVLGFLAAAVVLVRCVNRLGGVTGDVLGACVEAATLGVLVGLSA
ncbi:adenosylcobinamide-GDP ribazoletransferase, partial [Saccharomonospora iraqiensis]|uniref:adenosylcobinamide-GDP ribazoletransferase n=1 Tax=Saccharomonospora iraqiensis TaxID=52698 RepID=UPI0018DD0C9B